MSRERNRRIVFSSSVGLLQRITQALAALIALPLVIHALGVRGFGIWGAATSLAWLSTMLDFGLGSALINLLPHSLASGNTAKARGHVAATLMGSCGIAIVVLGVGIALVLTIARAEDVHPLLIAVIGLALNIPLSMAGNAWFGLQRGHIAGSWELFQTLLTLLSLSLVAALNGGVASMVAAVYATLVLTNGASLMHLMLRHPEIRPSHWRPSRESLRGVFNQGGILFAITLAVSSSYLFDGFLALQWLGPAYSAQITVALRLCTTAAGILAVLTQPLWPAFVEAASVGDRRWALRTFSWGTAAVAASAVGGGMLIICFGQEILHWWLHVDMGLRPVMLWSIAGWIVALSVPRVSTLLLSALSAFRFQFIVATAAAMVALMLKYSLSRRYGAAGILAATPISWLLIAWPAYVFKLSRGMVPPECVATDSIAIPGQRRPTSGKVIL